MRRIVWERGAWLFLKRWGGLPEMVVYGSGIPAAAYPAESHFGYEGRKMRGYSAKEIFSGGIRAAYRDLAHIRHEALLLQSPNFAK